MILSAETPPEKLLDAEEGSGDARLGAMLFQFDRTVCRPIEMQPPDYLAENRRTAVFAD